MYRIQKGEAYSGCKTIKVWFVKVKRETTFSHKWVNVKGYDSYDKAKRLLHILNGKEKL